MQLQTFEISSTAVIGSGNDYDLRILRHTLVYPSGIMYYQDEYIKDYGNGKTASERSKWIMIECPPVPDEPVGVFQYGGLFGAIMRSGKAYIYAAKPPADDDEDAKIAFDVFQRSHRIHEWPHEWVQFHGAIPETLSFLGK